jgi:hypothetical protein
MFAEKIPEKVEIALNSIVLLNRDFQEFSSLFFDQTGKPKQGIKP